MCVGLPQEMIELVAAMKDADWCPDFFTIDGGEGGTGAAPHEFSNSVGMPLEEGLYIVDNLLRGASLRNRTKIIAAGKIVSGFSIVKTLALGADLTNSARGMMFALGCIQALKCNTNRCPTGITTSNPDLQEGLVVPDKADRVASFQRRTVHMAAELVGAIGLKNPSDVNGSHLFRRTQRGKGVHTFREIFPPVPDGFFLDENGLLKTENLVDWFDTDRDGRVSVQEFRHAIERQG